jgi:UTP--glucose-1-phosphate uridylyltransferase
MKDYYELYGCSVLAVQTVPENQTMNYGIVAIESEGSDTQRVTKIVEKPSFGEAPSNLAVVGRYVLTSKIFEHLISTERGAGNEIQLTDAIARLISDEPVHVLPIEGTRYDCGSKLGYLQATVEYGMRHPDLGPEFRAYLNSLDS